METKKQPDLSYNQVLNEIFKQIFKEIKTEMITIIEMKVGKISVTHLSAQCLWSIDFQKAVWCIVNTCFWSISEIFCSISINSEAMEDVHCK